jgi:hypothetical protein
MEDATIMAHVDRLERYFLDTLTTAQRDAWNNRLDTRPPFDIKGTLYIAATPAAWGNTQVTPQRRWAWSQIYGAHRFGRAPIAAVAPLDEPAATTIAPTWTAPTLTVAVTPVAPVGGTFHVIIWATQPRGHPTVTPKWQLRPIAALTTTRTPFNFNLTPNFTARWPIADNQITYIRAACVNANNELVGLSDIERLDFT